MLNAVNIEEGIEVMLQLFEEFEGVVTSTCEEKVAKLTPEQATEIRAAVYAQMKLERMDLEKTIKSCKSKHAAFQHIVERMKAGSNMAEFKAIPDDLAVQKDTDADPIESASSGDNSIPRVKRQRSDE